MPILWLLKSNVVFVGPWNTSVAPSAFPSVNHFSASSCGRTWGCEASSWSPCHRYVHDCSWLIFLLIYEDSWWFMNIYDKACFLMIRLSYSNPDLLRFTILDLGIRLLNILTCGIWYKDPRTADDLGEFRVTHGQSSSTPSTSSCKISTSAVGIIVPFQRKRVGYQNQT